MSERVQNISHKSCGVVRTLSRASNAGIVYSNHRVWGLLCLRVCCVRDHLKPGRGRGDVGLGRGTGTRVRDAIHNCHGKKSACTTLNTPVNTHMDALFLDTEPWINKHDYKVCFSSCSLQFSNDVNNHSAILQLP